MSILEELEWVGKVGHEGEVQCCPICEACPPDCVWCSPDWADVEDNEEDWNPPVVQVCGGQRGKHKTGCKLHAAIDSENKILEFLEDILDELDEDSRERAMDIIEEINED